MKKTENVPEEGLNFVGPMLTNQLANQTKEPQTTPMTESPHPYEKGDEVPIL
ncbi:MAG: hypothetical protein WC523_05590 [Patescibacteria group bacterium]|jgi:hypothetical protein